MAHVLNPQSSLSPRASDPASGPAPIRMDAWRVRRELASQRAYCEGRSPFYVAVLAELEADAQTGPPWLDALQDVWWRRRFAVGWEAAHLLLAALHYAALSGEAPELSAVYPSCGGTGHPGGAVRTYMRRAPASFWVRLRTLFVQTNEVDRSIAWMVAAAAVFGSRNMPFHLVELGASAGLNLIGDHLPHTCRFLAPDGRETAAPAPWDSLPHDVLSRAGLDIHPRRLDEAADRLWLKACVWADDRERLERLDRAIEVFQRMQGDPAGPRVEEGSFEHAPQWLSNMRPPQPCEGLLVFNSIATIYLADAEYAALEAGMAETLAPWKNRAVWVEFERARGSGQGPLDLTVHRHLDGKWLTRVLATGAPRPQALELRDGWDLAFAS